MHFSSGLQSRAKVQSKRRPPSRRARQAGGSGLDFTDTTSSQPTAATSDTQRPKMRNESYGQATSEPNSLFGPSAVLGSKEEDVFSSRETPQVTASQVKITQEEAKTDSTGDAKADTQASDAASQGARPKVKPAKAPSTDSDDLFAPKNVTKKPEPDADDIFAGSSVFQKKPQVPDTQDKGDDLFGAKKESGRSKLPQKGFREDDDDIFGDSMVRAVPPPLDNIDDNDDDGDDIFGTSKVKAPPVVDDDEDDIFGISKVSVKPKDKTPAPDDDIFGSSKVSIKPGAPPPTDDDDIFGGPIGPSKPKAPVVDDDDDIFGISSKPGKIIYRYSLMVLICRRDKHFILHYYSHSFTILILYFLFLIIP